MYDLGTLLVYQKCTQSVPLGTLFGIKVHFWYIWCTKSVPSGNCLGAFWVHLCTLEVPFHLGWK